MHVPICIRWFEIFLLQSFFSPDWCYAWFKGRVNFYFAQNLCCLFFERFPTMRISFYWFFPRGMNKPHMWGYMHGLRGESTSLLLKIYVVYFLIGFQPWGYHLIDSILGGWTIHICICGDRCYLRGPNQISQPWSPHRHLSYYLVRMIILWTLCYILT